MNATPKRRRRFSREIVLDAAISVVRTGGLDALNIRAVASELGTGPMSLYNHVSDRDDMVAGIIARISDKIPHTSVQPSPFADVEAIFLTFYDALVVDPWIVAYVLEGHPATWKVVSLLERALLALSDICQDNVAALHGFVQLEHYLYGEVLGETAAPSSTTSYVFDKYFAEAETAGPTDPRCCFQAGVQRILRGLVEEASAREKTQLNG